MSRLLSYMLAGCLIVVSVLAATPTVAADLCVEAGAGPVYVRECVDV